jgi:ribosomal-protein-alanine N-acetyltransferase
LIPPWRLTTETTPAEIAGLDSLIFGAAGDSHESWANEMANGAAKIIVARHNGAAIGFVSFFRAGDDIEVRKIGVLAAWRRHGVAKNLLNEAIAVMPVTRCLIDVSAANTDAIAFYAKSGFREMARRRNYYANGSEAIVMEFIK